MAMAVYSINDESTALMIALQQAHEAMGEAAQALNAYRLCDVRSADAEAALFDSMFEAQRQAAAVHQALREYRVR
jgi:hypothetical protein